MVSLNLEMTSLKNDIVDTIITEIIASNKVQVSLRCFNKSSFQGPHRTRLIPNPYTCL